MIRVGVIGTGGISGVHLDFLKARPDVRVVALCDIKEEALRRRQQQYGGEGFHDFREMLKKVEMDAVYLCTPPWVREEPLRECAQRGIAVFCEKPVEHDVKKAARTAAALARRKARVQVGYVLRSMPIVRQFRESAKDDRIHTFHAWYCCNMSLSRTFPKWFYLKEQSGGPLVDQATHSLDLLRCLLGEVMEVRGAAENPVHRKTRQYTVEETFALSLRFRNRVVGSHVHTWVGDTWRHEMVFSGEKRAYRLNIGRGVLTVERSGGSLSVFKGEGETAPPELGGSTTYDQGPVSIYSFQNELFLKQLSSGDWSRNPSDYADGLKTLELCLAADRAVTTGQAQKL
jgi:predicted dehydrogenase